MGKPQYRLEYQSRFSDARFSPIRVRTLHQSPSQYTVLALRRACPCCCSSFDSISVRRWGLERTDSIPLCATCLATGASFAHHFFHKCIPLSAGGTFSCPFREILVRSLCRHRPFFLCHICYTNSLQRYEILCLFSILAKKYHLFICFVEKCCYICQRKTIIYDCTLSSYHLVERAWVYAFHYIYHRDDP